MNPGLPQPSQLCGEGWHHVGEVCLRINSSSESYDNAQHYCKNLGGNIASLLTDKQVHFVLEELQKYQLQDKTLSPWVGLRKINVSYWGWEDSSPFTNTSLRWLPGEPSDSGFCAYLEREAGPGLRANPCTAPTDGLICEKPAGSPQTQTSRTCRTSCFLRSSCSNCTSQAMECMWCSSTQRCVDSTAYTVSFPYGQCLEWKTQDCAGQLCGEGWHHVGEVCLRINSSSESYDNAQHYCKNLGGNIASLLTDKQVHFVLEELQKYQLQDKTLSPWVGLRKINVSYWGWEDSSPFTNTSLRWLPGEPSDSGFCAYLEREAAPGLRANPCTAPTDGLICEKPAGSPQTQTSRTCRTSCFLRSSCSNCTSQAMECMWCSSTQRCVDSTAYTVSFPYGQCLEWKTQDCAAQNCSGVRTCAECLERTECGWCGDPSNTGRGVCMEGSYRGPLKPAVPRAGPRDRERLRDRDMVLDQSLCSSDRGFDWAFIQCPACQCNGHSRCVNGSVCERCGNLTAGLHCQSCMPGYYGDPTNGGRCNACTCNSHANVCHVNTGKCFCTTKGIKGDQCQL
ncbi:hypothetical protein CesoFtcFv8_021392 [Champsocephalus esox]|uniref:Attractin-like protein 1 n=1 Tax=Champsocephalus esox TaxID=159716 RepID=A0AAN8GMT1_9TELE|nr:hypothetical protein CesoFtcFv8_021392 [Champsocephalus esox]